MQRQNKIKQEILTAIEKNRIKMLSFDFFDTLASRSETTFDCFYIYLAEHIREKLSLPHDINLKTMSSIRKHAENEIRKKRYIEKNHHEVSIFDIWGKALEFPNLFGSANYVELAKIETELDSSRLIPAHDLIEIINNFDIKVCILTDTFYDQDQIREFADKIGIKKQVQIFSSKNLQTGKYDRSFAKLIDFAKNLGISKSQILHIGDNHHSDFKKAQEFNIRAIHIPFGDSFFWNEQKIVDQYLELLNSQHYISGNPLKSLICRSLSRLQEYNYDKYGYYEYGVRSIGPIVASFCAWLHKRAISNKEDVLLFMMREGDLLSDAYNKLMHDSNQKIPNSIFFVSRRALKKSVLKKINRDSLSKIFTGVNNQTVREYCSLLELQEKETNQLTKFLNCELDASVDSIKEELIAYILSNHDIVRRISLTAKESIMGLVAHIKRSVLSSGKNWEDVRNIALIDVGWNGTIQKIIIDIFKEINPEIRFSGYYLSTTANIIESLDRPSSAILYNSYIFNQGEPKQFHDIFMRSPEIIEQCLTSPYVGTLINYTKSGDPVLSCQTLPLKQCSEIKKVQNGILDLIDYLSNYRDILEKICDQQYFKDWISAHLLRIIASPADEEIKLFDQWVHDENYSSQTSDFIVKTELSKWINNIPNHYYKNISMFDAYWLYALLVENYRMNPKKLYASMIYDELSVFNFSEYKLAVNQKNIDSTENHFKNPIYMGKNGFYVSEIKTNLCEAIDEFELKIEAPHIGPLWKIEWLMVKHGKVCFVTIDENKLNTNHPNLSFDFSRCFLINNNLYIGKSSSLKVKIDKFFEESCIIRIILKPVNLK